MPSNQKTKASQAINLRGFGVLRGMWSSLIQAPSCLRRTRPLTAWHFGFYGNLHFFDRGTVRLPVSRGFIMGDPKTQASRPASTIRRQPARIC